MDIQNCKSVYFLGIGGIGMSALARYFNMSGLSVSGYDKTPTALTSQLIKEGMIIHFEEDIHQIHPDPDLVIYTPAVPKEHKEFQYFAEKGIPIKKRAEVLGMITRTAKTIAIAGTHGKTTTSTLIAHILRQAGISFISFLGGISKNYQTNFIVSKGALIPSKRQNIKDPDYFIVEADEFDKSFLQLHPYIGVITSADADHLDIYGTIQDLRRSFREFTRNIEAGGILIMKKGIDIKPDQSRDYRYFTYSLQEEADYFINNVRIKEGLYVFDLHTPGKIFKSITLGLPGRFNLENGLVAAAVADILDIPHKIVEESLATFKGVQRRFDFQIRRDDFVYIDDYAHHPEELRACITAVKDIYPGKRITGIFQPHLYSRTRDLAEDFARSLELLDEIILLDIYAAREKPIKGITSAMLLGLINSVNKTMVSKENLLREIKSRRPEVLLTLGAGDIDQFVIPIKSLYE